MLIIDSDLQLHAGLTKAIAAVHNDFVQPPLLE